MLTGCPNIHGDDCQHAETLSIELSKGGRSCTETLRGFLHGGLFTKDHGTGLAVSLDVKMSSKTIEYGFDLVEEGLEDRVWARRSPETEMETDTETQRQRQRETERHTDTEKQTGRQTETQADREKDRETDRVTESKHDALKINWEWP